MAKASMFLYASQSPARQAARKTGTLLPGNTVGRSNRSDSRKRLQSGLRLSLAQCLPIAAGALVAEVGQVGVLRCQQPVFLGLGFRPRSGELLEGRRFSACPEIHREHTRNGAIPESAGGQVAQQSYDTLE